MTVNPRVFWTRFLICCLLFMFMLFPAQAAEKINVDFKDAKLTDVLYSLSYAEGLRVAINGSKFDNEKVVLHLPDTTALEVIEYLATIHNFNYVIEGQTILISPAEIMVQSRTFPLRYSDLEYAKKQLSLLFPENKINFNVEDSSITVAGTPGEIRWAEKRMVEMDKPVDQIFIQAQLVEVTRAEASRIGFNWEISRQYESGSSHKFQWAVVPEAEATLSNGKLIAKPFVSTLNGRKASLVMGERIPIFTTSTASDGSKTTTVEYETVGVILNVTPRVNRDANGKIFITMNLQPEVSAITSWESSNNNKAPIIASRKAETIVRVETGQAAIIGGLLKTDELKNVGGIPFLKDLPLLGRLFRYTEKSKNNSEIFILVTPRLITHETEEESFKALPVYEETLPDSLPLETEVSTSE